MLHTLKSMAAVGIALMLSGSASGQGVVMQRNLSLGLGKTIAEATIAECKAKSFNTAVVQDRY